MFRHSMFGVFKVRDFGVRSKTSLSYRAVVFIGGTGTLNLSFRSLPYRGEMG